MKLKGRNQIKKFKLIAGTLAAKMAAFEGVVGIVFIGGLTRGFADRYSDVDIIVFLGEKDEDLRKRIRKIGLDEQKLSGLDVDLEVHFLSDFRNRKWSEMERWDFSQAKIAFDPQGEIRRLFKKKMEVPKHFWIKRIVVYGEYLKWYCCPPSEGVGTLAETWVDRGDMLSAHYCMNYALDLMVNVLFALNKEFLPPPKWKIGYSSALKWLPPDYSRLVEEAMTVKNFSVNGLDRRVRALRELWKQTLPMIEGKTGLTPATISKCYVKKVLKQE